MVAFDFSVPPIYSLNFTLEKASQILKQPLVSPLPADFPAEASQTTAHWLSFRKAFQQEASSVSPCSPSSSTHPIFLLIFFYFSLQFELWDVSSLQPVNYPGFQYICIQQHAGSYQFICCALQPFSSTAVGGKNRAFSSKINK